MTRYMVLFLLLFGVELADARSGRVNIPDSASVKFKISLTNSFFAFFDVRENLIPVRKDIFRPFIPMGISMEAGKKRLAVGLQYNRYDFFVAATPNQKNRVYSPTFRHLNMLRAVIFYDHTFLRLHTGLFYRQGYYQVRGVLDSAAHLYSTFHYDLNELGITLGAEAVFPISKKRGLNFHAGISGSYFFLNFIPNDYVYKGFVDTRRLAEIFWRVSWKFGSSSHK